MQKVWGFVVVETVKELDYHGSKTKGYVSRMTKTCLGNNRVTNYSQRNRPHFIVTYYRYLGETQSLKENWNERPHQDPCINVVCIRKKSSARVQNDAVPWLQLWNTWNHCGLEELGCSQCRTTICWTSAVGRSSSSPVSMFRSLSVHSMK